MLTPWKESYDQHRQHITNQRHYFVNKILSSQGYGFSSGHVWMWELDCEDSWAPKNWWFWTVVLEKTLKSPLDYKEIQSVQFSHLVVSNSLRPHEQQHTRPPCPSPTPRIHPNPCPVSQWCHPTISSSVIHFSSCLNTSQHRGLFQWVSSSHQVAKVLEFQYQSFQWTPRTDLL